MTQSAFIANRTDGLGERLRALTNAIYLADKFDAKMYYEWKNRKGRYAEFNSVDEEDKIFDGGFIDTYSFAANTVKLMELAEIDLLDCANELAHESLPENVRVRVDQSKVYRLIPNLKEHYKSGGFAAAFGQINFGKRIVRSIKSAKDAFVPVGATAIHLRAGDLIYGVYNNTARFCGKAIPWEIADALIFDIRAQGHDVILFGQDSSLLSYLANKHHAYIATLLLDSDIKDSVEMAIQEIILLSRCSRIISGSSGFALLASSLAGEVHENIFRLNVSPMVTVLSNLSNQVDSRISLEQQIFSLRWLVGQYGHSLPPQELLRVSQHGLSLIPGDIFFLVTMASAMNALELFVDARKLISSIIASSSESDLKRIFSPSSFGNTKSSACLLNLISPQVPPSLLR